MRTLARGMMDKKETGEEVNSLISYGVVRNHAQTNTRVYS
jgi:hypothetical protein